MINDRLNRAFNKLLLEGKVQGFVQLLRLERAHPRAGGELRCRGPNDAREGAKLRQQGHRVSPV